MAVIITNMEIPRNCLECPLTYLDTGDDAYFGGTERRCVIDGSCIDGMKERAYDCPLKSTDEMIAEIEHESELSNSLNGISEIGLRKAMKIIRKYCDKEQKNE